MNRLTAPNKKQLKIKGVVIFMMYTTSNITIAVKGTEVYAVTGSQELSQFGAVTEATEVVVDGDSYIITPDGVIYGNYQNQLRREHQQIGAKGVTYTLRGWNEYGFRKESAHRKVELVAIRCKLYH